MSFDTTLITADWDMGTLREPVLRNLHAYWESRRGDRPMPARADIDIVQIPTLLPYLFLIDVLDAGRDFRFRLAGTHIRDVTDDEVTGQHVGEAFPPDFGAEVRRIWSKVVEKRRPVCGRGRLWVPGREHVTWEGVAMPLAEDDGVVNMLLGGVVFQLRSRDRAAS
jgi:hypothetical protein